MTIFVRPSLASLSTLGLILGVTGCPGPSPIDDAAAVVDAASPDAPSALDAHVHEDDAPALDAFTASDAPSSVDAHAPPLDVLATDAPPIDAPGALEVALTETFAYGNCFGGPPDPLLAGFTLRVTGAMGDRVEITNAKLRVVVESRGYDETQDLIVAPSAFAHTRTGTDEYMIRKESGSPSIPMCTFCSDTVTGELSFDVTTLAGTEHHSEPVELGCVF
ncbi:MAG: hypothetical protein J0L92_17240 [Deltaproteobacteria bacterium]|nr:hypothetical protein [Deltaproteobacteria bacterium]